MVAEVLVIIVSYESSAVLQRCLDALKAQTYSRFEAVIWDNASRDGGAADAVVDERFTVILNTENIGFAAANNRAAALSASRYIVALNPDAFPETDWLAALVTTAEATGAEAVGSLQIDDGDPGRLDGAGDCMSVAGVAWRGGFLAPRSVAPTATSQIFAPCAAAALYKRTCFESLGGFDERFFCYCEDVDLGFRIRLSGGRCLLEPRAVVRHLGSSSSGGNSDFAEYHGARNRLWTFLKNMPGALMPLAGPLHLLIVSYVLLRSPALLPPRLRGLRDGWAGRAPFLADRRQWWPSRGLLASLTWSPVAISRRAVKARPL